MLGVIKKVLILEKMFVYGRGLKEMDGENKFRQVGHEGKISAQFYVLPRLCGQL